MIDDYVCLRIHDRSERVGPDSPDAVLMDQARMAYEDALLEEAKEKHVLQSNSLTIWGTSVDSDSGRVGPPHRSLPGSRPSGSACRLSSGPHGRSC